MLIRLTVTIVLYVLMLASNASALKRSSRKDLAVYGAMTMLSAYAGILFVLQKQWPNLDTILYSIYAWPAKAIIRMFKPS